MVLVSRATCRLGSEEGEGSKWRIGVAGGDVGQGRAKKEGWKAGRPNRENEKGRENGREKKREKWKDGLGFGPI